jgi:hypothetical protein
VADVADVEAALVGAVLGTLYPNGATTLSATGTPVRVFRGWPTTGLLMQDRAAGGIDISVFGIPGTTRNTTRWGVQVSELPSDPSLSVEVSGNSATFLGTAAQGDLAGALVEQNAYVYQAQQGDSAALVTAALADLIRADMICWVTQATLTVPGVSALVARTASAVSALVEWGRQEQQFRISVWAPSPAARDGCAALVMQGLVPLAFITLSDGTGGRLRFHGTANLDDDQTASIYRRDMIFIVEFGTTLLVTNPTMLFGDLDYNGSVILA